MFPGMIVPETAVCLRRTVKEPGNATSLAVNVLVNLLEPTAMVSACSFWQASNPKGRSLKVGSAGELEDAPDMSRACGKEQRWKGR